MFSLAWILSYQGLNSELQGLFPGNAKYLSLVHGGVVWLAHTAACEVTLKGMGKSTLPKHNTTQQSANFVHNPWDVLYIQKTCKFQHNTMMTSSNENISALLSLCAWNSPVTGEFPAQRPLTRSFDVFFDLRLDKRLCKQSWGWWFETLSRPLWRHSNVQHCYTVKQGLEPWGS